MIMKRRNFLKTLGGMAVLSQVPISVKAAESEECNEKESKLDEITYITIPVGAADPFYALHITDTHLTRVNEKDNQRKKEVSEWRRSSFPKAEAYFDAALKYAREEKMVLLHTGDLIDFVSEGNLEYVKQKLKGVDCFFAAGNHEFSQYVGEAKEDEAYKAQDYEKIQAAYPNNLKFASRIINGVNFVALDDVYYNVTKEHLDLMKEEVKKGLPIVIMCHVPFYTPHFYEIEMHKTNGACAYVAGAPHKLTETYPSNPDLPADEQWRNRGVQQRADKHTLEFVKWLKKQSLVKAILCGHNHDFYQGPFSDTAMQHMAGATYAGKATEIKFI
jgi:predicted MPP superfamily phosphohydrolase